MRSIIIHLRLNRSSLPIHSATPTTPEGGDSIYAAVLFSIGPGADTTEFVDVGVAQLGQRGGGSLTAVSATAIDQHRGILVRNHLGGSCFVNATHRQQDSAGNVATVVLVLLPHIQNDDLLGVHHLFGFFLGDLLVGAVCGIPAASGQQQQK